MWHLTGLRRPAGLVPVLQHAEAGSSHQLNDDLGSLGMLRQEFRSGVTWP